MLAVLCSLLGCQQEDVTIFSPGQFVVNGQSFYVVGPEAPAGLPAEQSLTLVGTLSGYRVYTLQ